MNTLHTLVHTTLDLPHDGIVLVLNNGAVISPEAEAMLQALHSRSTGGIREHLKVLEAKGPEKFMGTFYVGYGHKSIGDCGNVTVFVEGVSMLVAKAIQDWRLYSGQESSTRYVDFSKQTFFDPTESTAGADIQEAWRAFYLKGLPIVGTALTERYPRQPDEKETTYEKAIAARAFDIMRSFLPAGATTNLAIHMNLRQFADALALLRHHPLAEVRNTADTIEQALIAAYPDSFSHKRYDATEAYNASIMANYYYQDATPPICTLARDNIDRAQLAEYHAALTSRPPKTELPRHIAECGTMQFRFLLDFGSFRDIQRQRSVVQRMPLLTMQHGFHPWYLTELPEALRSEAETLIMEQQKAIEKLEVGPEVAQYFTPMGFQVPCRLTGDLHALTYVVELRATRFVHPTLATVASTMAGQLREALHEDGLVLHLDDEPNRFDVRRGEHDIIRND